MADWLFEFIQMKEINLFHAFRFIVSCCTLFFRPKNKLNIKIQSNIPKRLLRIKWETHFHNFYPLLFVSSLISSSLNSLFLFSFAFVLVCSCSFSRIHFICVISNITLHHRARHGLISNSNCTVVVRKRDAIGGMRFAMFFFLNVIRSICTDKCDIKWRTHSQGVDCNGAHGDRTITPFHYIRCN